MKKLVLLLTFVSLSLVANAQSFKKGDKVVNLGIGIGGGYTSFPPIGGSLEYGIKDTIFNTDGLNLGVGGVAQYYSQKDDYAKYSEIAFGVRGLLHYQFVNNLDTYGGLGLGFNYSGITSYIGEKDYRYNYRSSGVYLGLILGARYYFTDKIAAFAEVGYDVALFKAGIAFKL